MVILMGLAQRWEVSVSIDVAPYRRVTLAEIRAHKDAIAKLGRKYGVSNIRVFGSVARGEADQDSDLDLLIDVAPGHGYFDMAAFALDVEDILGVFTQVATERGLKERMRERILAEAVVL
jgi:predicted nucleotidyltransferase